MIQAAAKSMLASPPVAWLRGTLRRLRRDERGSNAVEFGLCAIPFFGLVACAAEASYINYFTDALQLAVNQAARAVATGEAQGDGGTTPNPGYAATAASFAQNFICTNTGIGTFNGTYNGSQVGTVSNLPGYMKCNSLVVDIRPAVDFSTASSDMKASIYGQPTLYCLGLPQQIMVMRVVYPLPAVLPLALFSNAGTVTTGTGKVHLVTATASFENEPYQNDGKNGNVSYTPPTGC